MSNDTIYIYYDNDKAKTSKIKSRLDQNKSIVECQLIDYDGRKIFIRADKTTREIIPEKKFLKKNSRQTVTFELLELNGVGNTFFNLFEIAKYRKTFFLVTKKSKKRVIIQKASVSYPEFIVM